MQTTLLHFSHVSSGQYGWASVGEARAEGTSTVLRELRESVLAKGIRAALLVLLFKSGCHGQRGFGRVKSGVVCTGIDLVWSEGGALPAVATPSVRSNTAFEWDALKRAPQFER